MPNEGSPTAVVDFCGEEYTVPQSGALTIGREGDIAIDDNEYLHRRFLELTFHNEMLWLSNVGSLTSVTVSDVDGLLQSWLSPGASLPIVFPRALLWFTAGPTTYELHVALSGAPFLPSPDGLGGSAESSGETTGGRISLTPEQRLLITVLAEDILRRGNRSSGVIPQTTVAADRLGWTTTKFNRKLDNVCAKFSRLGVRGLVTDGSRSASNRRARLVEYALAARLITTADLAYLDSLGERSAARG